MKKLLLSIATILALQFCFDLAFAIDASEYEKNGTMPTAPTGQVVVTLNDSGLSMDGVYGNYEAVQFKAFIGNVGYETLQEAINDVKDGEEIILAEDCSENVSFRQAVKSIRFTINGNNNTMTGIIKIEGVVIGDVSDSIGLTIKNVNFYTSETTPIFIDGVPTDMSNFYISNLTVQDCLFTGPSSSSSVVPVKVKYAKNLKMIDCVATGVNSLFQSSGDVRGCTFLRCEVTNSGRGMNLDSVKGEVLIEDCVISALSTKYGIRIDGDATDGYDITIKNSSIDAFIPVCVRNASKNGTITFEGENTITARNTDGIWCAIGASEYEKNGTMPDAPTGQVVVTLNDSGLSMDGVYGNYEAVQFKAFIGDVGYGTLQEAINDVKDGEEIILAEDCSENVSIAQVSNLKFTINGDNKTMTGKITITGVVVGKISDSIGLTIKNVNFASESTIKHIFIEGNKNNYYPCNITVEKCSFTGPSSDSVIVPISVKHAQNFKMIDCEVTGVDSLFQSSGNGYNCTFLRCEVANSGRGINLNSVYGEVLIEDCVISALSTKYGIRVDGTAATGYDITIKNSSIDAFIPVCVRKASKNGTITFEGENTITARNTDGIWCAIGTSEYETNGTMPTAPTGQVVVTLNDSGLSMDGVYGNYVAPSQEDGYDTIISTNFGNLTTEEVASVKAKLATLGEAVGGQDKVAAYFATVYGANKVDATKFAATTLALFKISECFALPLLENEPSISIGKIETASGAVGFEFTIMDGQDAVAIIDNIKTKKLVKYVEQLANGFEYNDEQVAIVLDVNNKKIKATFADMSKLSGFMKVDFSVPEAQ